MKIIDERKSLETCTESGWDAIDLMMDEPMDDKWIEKLRNAGGSFIYMKMLKKPFFKLESHNYMAKGVQGDMFFRVSFHRDYRCEADRIIKLMNDESAC